MPERREWNLVLAASGRPILMRARHLILPSLAMAQTRPDFRNSLLGCGLQRVDVTEDVEIGNV